MEFVWSSLWYRLVGVHACSDVTFAKLLLSFMAELTSGVNLLLTGCILLSFGCNLRAVPSLLVALFTE
jgi:hypothetical protein